MTTRFNGYNKDAGNNQNAGLGYFQGDNALISVAVQQKDAAGAFEVLSTGVRAPLAEFKRMYAYDPASDIGATVTVDVDADHGTDTEDLDNISNKKLAEMFGGTEAAPTIDTDAKYLAAYAAQENLRRIIDIIQQRAVIMGVSEAAPTSGDTDALTAASGWSSDVTSTATALVHTMTFMVERADVFNRMRPNLYGQPEATEPVVGQELVDDLKGLPMLLKDGVATASLDGTDVKYAVRVDRSIPRIQ